MRKLLIGLTTMAVSMALFAGPAFAKAERLNWGSQLNASQCDQSSSPVINVVQNVVNDVDSGTAGNNWAFDNITRQIQVWPQANGTYCVLVRNDGKFDAQSGQRSPGNTGDLSGLEDGTFQGGYRGTITGTLNPDPTWSTSGDLGTIDYGCNISGVCPGYKSWIEQYFNSGYTFGYDWWGWIYNAGSYGTWVNSIYSNSGDIL